MHERESILTTMLVEDNATFREAVWDDLLSRCPFMKVSEAKDGEEARVRFFSDFLNLVFMDISLPGQNGIALAKEIKALYRDLIVVMLTGYSLDVYRKAAFAAGANGFIDKGSADLAAQILAVVNCLHAAKEAGRSKPGCLLA